MNEYKVTLPDWKIETVIAYGMTVNGNVLIFGNANGCIVKVYAANCWLSAEICKDDMENK